jgi:hypothetical protein
MEIQNGESEKSIISFSPRSEERTSILWRSDIFAYEMMFTWEDGRK